MYLDNPMQARRSIGPTKIAQIVSNNVSTQSQPPYGYMLVAACDFSKKTRDAFRAAILSVGVEEYFLWGKAEIEDQLFLPKKDEEEGTTTTPFDMVVLNDPDRFHLVMDVIERVPKLRDIGGHVVQSMRDNLIDHKQYIMEHGEDMPELRTWKWPY